MSNPLLLTTATVSLWVLHVMFKRCLCVTCSSSGSYLCSSWCSEPWKGSYQCPTKEQALYYHLCLAPWPASASYLIVIYYSKKLLCYWHCAILISGHSHQSLEGNLTAWPLSKPVVVGNCLDRMTSQPQTLDQAYISSWGQFSTNNSLLNWVFDFMYSV